MKQKTQENPARTKRLSRYTADKSAFPDFKLTTRDSEILQLVYFHRFLDVELLGYLLQVEGSEAVEKRVGKDGKLRPAKQGFGVQALQRRLTLLFNTGYLERPPLLDQPIGRGYGSPRAVYGIGPKSCVSLARALGTTPDAIRRVVEANQVKTPFLRHALDTARFRVMLELGCRDSKGRVRLVFWEQGQHLRDTATGQNEYGDDERFAVYPDAFFAIEVEGKGISNYMLEVDRGTEPIASPTRRPDIRKKLIGYRFYRKQKSFQRRYSYLTLPTGEVTGIRIHADGVNLSDVSPEMVIPGYTVLFLTTGNAVPEHPTRGRIANILSALPSFGSGFKPTMLYWFCPISEFSLSNPGSVFARVWRTAHLDKDLQSLIE